MPRNTSIRRAPIRNDWNRSRATNCGVVVCIEQRLGVLSAANMMQAQAHLADNRSIRTQKAAANNSRRLLDDRNSFTPFPSIPASVDRSLLSHKVRDRVGKPRVPRGFRAQLDHLLHRDNNLAVAARPAHWQLPGRAAGYYTRRWGHPMHNTRWAGSPMQETSNPH